MNSFPRFSLLYALFAPLRYDFTKFAGTKVKLSDYAMFADIKYLHKPTLKNPKSRHLPLLGYETSPAEGGS